MADSVRMFASGNRAIAEVASTALRRWNRRCGVRGVPSIANRQGGIGAISCAITESRCLIGYVIAGGGVGVVPHELCNRGGVADETAMMLSRHPRDLGGGLVSSAAWSQKWRRRYPSSCAIAETASARSMSCSSCVSILRSLTLPAASSSPPMITMWLAPSLSACLNCALSDLPW